MLLRFRPPNAPEKFPRSEIAAAVFDAAQEFAPLPQRRLQKRSAVHPKQIESDKGDRHVGGGDGKQIGAFIFSAQPFLQIEKGQLLPVLEGHDLAIENQIRRESSRACSAISTNCSVIRRRSREKISTRSLPRCSCARIPSNLSST